MPRKRKVHHKKRKTLAAKVAKLTKIVKQEKSEAKYTDCAFTAQQFNYTPTSSYVIDILQFVAQGIPDNNARIGDKIFVKNIQLRGTLYNSTYTPFNARLVLFRVVQSPDNLYGTTNLGNMVMESTYSSTVNAVNAPFDHDNRAAFQILWDHRFTLNPISQVNGVNTSMTGSKNFKKYFKVNKVTEFFQGATAGYTKGGLYMLCISDVAASASQYAALHFRVNYTDS